MSVVYGSLGDAFHVQNIQSETLAIVAREDKDFAAGIPPLTIDNCYAGGAIEQKYNTFSPIQKENADKCCPIFEFDPAGLPAFCQPTKMWCEV